MQVQKLLSLLRMVGGRGEREKLKSVGSVFEGITSPGLSPGTLSTKAALTAWTFCGYRSWKNRTETLSPVSTCETLKETSKRLMLDGSAVGREVGETEGEEVGWLEGRLDGWPDGCLVGCDEGLPTGCLEGRPDGCLDG